MLGELTLHRAPRPASRASWARDRTTCASLRAPPRRGRTSSASRWCSPASPASSASPPSSPLEARAAAREGRPRGRQLARAHPPAARGPAVPQDEVGVATLVVKELGPRARPRARAPPAAAVQAAGSLIDNAHRLLVRRARRPARPTRTRGLRPRLLAHRLDRLRPRRRRALPPPPPRARVRLLPIDAIPSTGAARLARRRASSGSSPSSRSSSARPSWSRPASSPTPPSG